MSYACCTFIPPLKIENHNHAEFEAQNVLLLPLVNGTRLSINMQPKDSSPSSSILCVQQHQQHHQPWKQYYINTSTSNYIWSHQNSILISCLHKYSTCKFIWTAGKFEIITCKRDRISSTHEELHLGFATTSLHFIHSFFFLRFSYLLRCCPTSFFFLFSELSLLLPFLNQFGALERKEGD